MSGTVAAFVLPPGPCSVSFYAAGTASGFLGTSQTVSTSSGLQAPTSPLSFEAYQGSAGATFYGTTGSSASTASVFWAVSTAG